MFNNFSFATIGEIPEAIWLLLAKGCGAIAGSAISIVYVLPKDKREAAIRFAVGVMCGMIFGPLAGLKILDYLNIIDKVSRFEAVMVGAAATSLTAWWAIGFAQLLMERRLQKSGLKKY